MQDNHREKLDAARALYQKKDFVRAQPLLEALIADGLPYADVQNMLGVIHHDQGHFPAAKKCFEAALTTNPGYTEAALNLAVLYNDMGQYTEAMLVYSQAISTPARSTSQLDPYLEGKIANAYADIAATYLAAGAYEAAILEFRRALALGPGFVDIRLRLAEALRDMGRLTEAGAELEEILRQKPGYVPARLHYALNLFAQGHPARAEAELEHVLSEQPNHRRARAYREMIRSHRTKDNQATADL